MFYKVKIEANDNFFKKTGLMEDSSYGSLIESADPLDSNSIKLKMVIPQTKDFKNLNFLIEVKKMYFTPDHIVIYSWINLLKEDDSYLCSATLYLSP